MGSVEREEGSSIVGVLGVLTGIDLIGLVVVSASLGSPAPLDAYSSYLGHVNLYWTWFALSSLSAVLGIPFLAGLVQHVGSRSRRVTSAAMLTTTAGIIVATLATVLTVSVLYSISQIPVGLVNQGSAEFEAAVWLSITDGFIPIGYALLGMGFVLLAWLGWSDDRMPRWVAIVTAVGGVAGLVTPFASIGFEGVPVIVLAAAIVVSFAMGIQLLRGDPEPSNRASG